MKRRRVFFAVGPMALAIAIGYLLIAQSPAPSRPVTIAFLGFTNALPFVGAPEELRSLRAIFQVTNHEARTMTYHSKAHASQAGGKGSSLTHANFEVPAHGTRTFMLSTIAATNQWTFTVVTSSSRPRPAWQHRIRELSKRFGGPRVFIGPAQTYHSFTNVWMTP